MNSTNLDMKIIYKTHLKITLNLMYHDTITYGECPVVRCSDNLLLMLQLLVRMYSVVNFTLRVLYQIFAVVITLLGIRTIYKFNK